MTMIRHTFKDMKDISGLPSKCTECKKPASTLISLTADDPGCAAEVCESCLRSALALAEDPDWPEAGLNQCPSRFKKGEERLLCSRRAGHDGEHVATDGKHVIDSWEEDEAEKPA